VGLLVAGSGLHHATATGGTDILLLTCMDFRLIDEIELYMNARGLRDRYDHVILAGASLGALTDRHPAWNQTFWDHLEMSIQLHNIHKVILMDHRDCGAYKVLLGTEHTEDPDVEKDTHARRLGKLQAMILEKYPQLEVETLLMGLDGKVETVGDSPPNQG